MTGFDLESLDILAKSVSEKAAESATSLQESIDALKALTAYALAKRKLGADEDEDGSDKLENFEHFQGALTARNPEPPNGGAKPSSTRRRDS